MKNLTGYYSQKLLFTTGIITPRNNRRKDWIFLYKKNILALKYRNHISLLTYKK